MPQSLWRFDIVMPFLSHLPRDVAVNVMYGAVDDSAPASGIVDATATRLALMYSTGVTDQTHPLGYYMGSCIDRSLCRVDGYPQSSWGTGDGPAASSGFPMAAAGGASDFPGEVALCVTLEGTGISFAGTTELPRKRRLGRSYIGPLSSTAGGVDDTFGVTHPSAVFVADLVLAFASVSADSTPGNGGSGMGIWSRTSSDLTIITQGWVDNEWDTQRRRGSRPTHRSTWVNP